MLGVSRVWLSVTSWTVAHKAPLCMEFSRQEYWNGWPIPTPGKKVEMLVTQSCLTLCNPMDCSFLGSPVHGILQAKIMESCHSLLQEIFQIQGLNLAQADYLQSEPPGKPFHIVRQAKLIVSHFSLLYPSPPAFQCRNYAFYSLYNSFLEHHCPTEV